MASKVTMRHTQNLMARLASSINRLAQHSLKKGKPVPFGPMTPPTPNTVLGRAPNPFTGGN
jgi:hypothetical protein